MRAMSSAISLALRCGARYAAFLPRAPAHPGSPTSAMAIRSRKFLTMVVGDAVLARCNLACRSRRRSTRPWRASWNRSPRRRKECNAVYVARRTAHGLNEARRNAESPPCPHPEWPPDLLREDPGLHAEDSRPPDNRNGPAQIQQNLHAPRPTMSEAVPALRPVRGNAASSSDIFFVSVVTSTRPCARALPHFFEKIIHLAGDGPHFHRRIHGPVGGSPVR